MPISVSSWYYAQIPVSSGDSPFICSLLSPVAFFRVNSMQLDQLLKNVVGRTIGKMFNDGRVHYELNTLSNKENG